MRRNIRKSDLVLVVELAIERPLVDYLRDCIDRWMTCDEIAADINGYMKNVLPVLLYQRRFCLVAANNVTRWFQLYGLRSKLRQGHPLRCKKCGHIMIKGRCRSCRPRSDRGVD